MQSILCFGDSNTWGLNPRDNSRFDDQTRWTGLLDDLLRPFGKRVIEEGLCGRTTQFHDWYRKNRCGLDAFPLLLESHSPLAGVVIMLGTNDCKTCFHASAEQIAEGVRQLVRQAKHAGVPEILVVSPIVLGHGVAQFDGEFNEACTPGVPARSRTGCPALPAPAKIRGLLSGTADWLRNRCR